MIEIMKKGRLSFCERNAVLDYYEKLCVCLYVCVYVTHNSVCVDGFVLEQNKEVYRVGPLAMGHGRLRGGIFSYRNIHSPTLTI